MRNKMSRGLNTDCFPCSIRVSSVVTRPAFVYFVCFVVPLLRCLMEHAQHPQLLREPMRSLKSHRANSLSATTCGDRQRCATVPRKREGVARGASFFAMVAHFLYEIAAAAPLTRVDKRLTGNTERPSPRPSPGGRGGT
jgi:hypothetical protein